MITMSRKVFCPYCTKIIIDGSTCSCRKEHRKTYEKARSKTIGENPYKSKRWRTLRERIIQRDGYNCQRCLLKYDTINGTDLQVHHIQSYKNNPSLMWDEENLMCICGTCNKILGTKDKLDFDYETRQEDIEIYL